MFTTSNLGNYFKPGTLCVPELADVDEAPIGFSPAEDVGVSVRGTFMFGALELVDGIDPTLLPMEGKPIGWLIPAE